MMQTTDLPAACASLKKRNKQPLAFFKELGFLMKVQITLLKAKFNYYFLKIISKKHINSQNFLCNTVVLTEGPPIWKNL